MTDKVHCRVKGCHRGIGKERAIRLWGTSRVSFICGFHWKRLTKAEKRVWSRLKRLEKRTGPTDRSQRIWQALIRRSGLPDIPQDPWEECSKCDDSGFVDFTSGGIWTGVNITTRREYCDCACGDDARRQYGEPN